MLDSTKLGSCGIELIDTWWDVNYCLKTKKAVSELRINRYMVGCKFIKFVRG